MEWATDRKLVPIIEEKSREDNWVDKLMDSICSYILGTAETKEKEPVTLRTLSKNFYEVEEVKYAVLEVSPSKLTSNANVKWLISEFARTYKPLDKRIRLRDGKLIYTPEMSVWWEIVLYENSIKFYFVIPDKDNMKMTMMKQIMKTWKQSNVREVPDYMPKFDPANTDITSLVLKNHPVLALDLSGKSMYSILETVLNTKHHLKTSDSAIVQIGITPTGSGWNDSAMEIYEKIKETGEVPKKNNVDLTWGQRFQKIVFIIGLIAEEFANLLGDFLIPGWEDDRLLGDTTKKMYGQIESIASIQKIRSDTFKTDIRIVSKSDDEGRRKSITQSLCAGFDPLEGDNRFLSKPLGQSKKKDMFISQVVQRKSSSRDDILCSAELSRIINVPDQKMQAEHYNELNLVSHRGESEIPGEVLVDAGGIPFALYQDTDGVMKSVYYSVKDPNLLCMTRVLIGEPNTGKTTSACNFSIDAFMKGYGVMVIDAADGKMIQKILNSIPPEYKPKVKIIDFLNSDYPIGLGWNEIFRGKNMDIIEDLLVEEVIHYIELVSGIELNMRSYQWVENAVKAVFTTPDATIQDIENMLNNSEYRQNIIETIEDPELKRDWEHFHNKMGVADRRMIYDEAFRRMSKLVRKKTLKNFILQKPKKDENGNYLVDLRKWMDEGYLVLVKANETLGETLQTALVSFLLAKFNLAMISREDVENEDDRKPCFLVLDEPDHYIKGSERWRGMLTRYRKYRCGLMLMFHGWQQLKKTDKELPNLIRKSGPHYMIFQTDEENLLELKSVIEPEYRVKDIAKGMPQYHALIRLKMYNADGGIVPAFMAKAVDDPKRRFIQYNNNDLYLSCAKELGRPKKEVMEEVFRYKTGGEFDIVDFSQESSSTGEGMLKSNTEELELEEKLEKDKRARMIIVHEVDDYIRTQLEKGEDPDIDLIEHMDEVLEEG